MKRFILSLFVLMGFQQQLAAFGGTVPAGMPSYFGFGVNDKWDDFAPNGPHKWKSGQGNTCWDYSYVYMVPGWRGWVSPNGEWAKRELQAWEGLGQMQVFTFYYSYGDPNYFTNTGNMSTYWSDLAKAFEISAQYSTRRVIFHFEPDGIGFWRQQGTGTYNTNGKVIVGGATSPTGGNVNGLAWNTTNFPNTLVGWNKAIWHLRLHYENLNGGGRKILLAHHYTHWATGTDVFASPASAGGVDGATNDMGNFILNIENGLNFDFFFADPADRDADFWYVKGCGSPSNQSRWAKADYAYSWGTRSWGTEGYVVDSVSTKLGRRGFMWQVPVGNTFYRTQNNSNGHFRDNRVQAFLPSVSYNGASGVPGDAYSSGSGTTGPGFWVNHGIIGVLYGSGGYDDTPSPCNGGGDNLSHVRDRRADGTTNPGTNAAAGYVGSGGYSAWGQANSTVSDDDGGYLRNAVSRYCSTGKYPIGAVPTATRTETVCVCSPTFTPTPTVTPADCPLVFNSCDALTSNGNWIGAGASEASMTFPGSTGNAVRFQLTTLPVSGYYNDHMVLDTFSPTLWTGYSRISLDVYVDPSAMPWTAGSTYHQFRLLATTGAKYEKRLGPAVDLPLVAGLNKLEFDLTFPGGAEIGPAEPLVKLFFILNQDPTADQAGNIFIDNIVLHTDAVCPPPTATSTSTRTPTPSRTRTITPLPSDTSTGTPTRTRTPTPSSTRTRTPTPSSTDTPLPATFTSTRTATPSRTSTSTATNTRTVTGTSTSTQTPLPPSATSTSTSTRTATSTRTVTQSSTATPSITVSPTSSNTPLPGSTFTNTSTVSPVNSATSTATPSRTATATASVTVVLPSATSTHTPLPGSTLTHTSTVSPVNSNTSTATPSATAMATASMTVVLPSATSSQTPLPGSTFTHTSTLSPVNSSTSTATPSATATATASVTVVLPSATSSQTPLPGSTFTNTSTTSPTFSATPTSIPPGAPGEGSATLNPTTVQVGDSGQTFTVVYTAVNAWTNGTLTLDLPSGWPSFSAVGANAGYTTVSTSGSFAGAVLGGGNLSINISSLPAGGTITVVYGSTALGGPGVTVPNSPGLNDFVLQSDPNGTAVAGLAINPQVDVKVPTATATATSTVTPIPFTPTFTSTVTPTLADTAVPTVAPTALNGANEIEDHVAAPNPWNGVGPGYVAFKLNGPCDRVELKVYTNGMTLIGETQGGPQTGGWVKLGLPAEMSGLAGNGTYYYVVGSERAGEKNLTKAVGKLVVLR